MVQQARYSTAYEDNGYYEDPLEQAIRDYIATNPSPAELAAAMAQYGVSADQISNATGYTVEQVNTYVAPAVQAPEPVAPPPEPVYQAPAPVAPPVEQYQAPPPQTVTAPVAPPPPPPPPVQQAVTPVAPQVQAAAPPSAAQATTASTTTTTTAPTVAQVTAAIDKWQTDNPGATPQQLATAIKNGMGLTTEVTQALANKYNMSTADVTASYNDLITKPPEVLPPTVAQVTAAIDKWSADNPGATPAQLATAIKNGMGMTPEVTQALANKYNMSTSDVVTSYNNLIAQPPVTAPPTTTTTAPVDPYAGVAVQDYRGQSYSASDLIKLATQVAQNLDVSKSSGGAYGTSKENIGFDYNTLSSAYGGKAFTAGDQVAFDIARQLLDQGITNYDQVKNAQKTTITEQQVMGSGEDQQVYDVQREAYIDPVTGREIRTDIGSTYTGKGNTQYHIDPTTGKFYTTAESSSDVSPEMMMALSIGASFLMPGVGEILAAELGVSAATGTALANAGLQLAMGADPKTVLLNAGLAVSGVTKDIGNFAQTGLENLTTGLPEGLITEKMLSTAATAITRAGTTFLTTGSAGTALTAAAGSVVNDVVSDRTGSTALGAGAAAYVQTGSLNTAALVATNAAAYNAGQNYKTDVVNLFNGAKDSVLQTLTANSLSTSGITQADLDDLFDPSKNPYLTSTDITQLAQANNTGVVTDAGAGTNDNRVEGAWTSGPNGQRRWVEVKGADGETKYAGWETVDPVTGEIYGTITSGGVDKDGNPTDVYVTGLRGGIPINVDVTKSDAAGAFSVKAVKPTNLTLGGTANATPNAAVISTANAISTANNATSVSGNITATGGNVGGTGGNVTGGNVITVGTGGNANVSITGGTGGNGNANIGGTGGNAGNITVGGNATGGNANVTVGGNVVGNITGNVGGTGGNITGNVGGTGGNVSIVGNVTGDGNVITIGNTVANTTGNVSVVGNTVANTTSNVSTVGNTITVINTPNTTPNISTPITTTLGTAITPLKFASGGLNPGYIAPTPFYPTTNDAQSKFYWGSHPYQTGGPTGQVFDPVLYNTVPEAPKIPFGSQAVTQPLTSAEIAAIVANPGSNNSQQTTQAASSYAPTPVAPVTTAPSPITVPTPVAPVTTAPSPITVPTPVTPTPVAQDPDLPMGYRYASGDEINNGTAKYDPVTNHYIAPFATTQPAPVQQPVAVPTPIAPELSAPVATPAPVAPVYEPPAPVQQPPNYYGGLTPGQALGGEFTVQPPARDPRFAGMPDDMYNNMMEFNQRVGPSGALTMDVKSWDEWMFNQRQQQQPVFEQGPNYPGKDFGPSALYNMPQAPVQPPPNYYGDLTPGQALGGEFTMLPPVPVAPVYEPPAQTTPARDPMYAGMPDDLYNGMMAERQREQEYQAQNPGPMLRTGMIRPWDQWMYDQQNQPGLNGYISPLATTAGPVAP